MSVNKTKAEETAKLFQHLSNLIFQLEMWVTSYVDENRKDRLIDFDADSLALLSSEAMLTTVQFKECFIELVNPICDVEEFIGTPCAPVWEKNNIMLWIKNLYSSAEDGDCLAQEIIDERFKNFLI